MSNLDNVRYVRKQKIVVLLNEMVLALTEAKPADPVEFLIYFLKDCTPEILKNREQLVHFRKSACASAATLSKEAARELKPRHVAQAQTSTLSKAALPTSTSSQRRSEEESSSSHILPTPLVVALSIVAPHLPNLSMLTQAMRSCNAPQISKKKGGPSSSEVRTPFVVAVSGIAPHLPLLSMLASTASPATPKKRVGPSFARVRTPFVVAVSSIAPHLPLLSMLASTASLVVHSAAAKKRGGPSSMPTRYPLLAAISGAVPHLPHLSMLSRCCSLTQWKRPLFGRRNPTTCLLFSAFPNHRLIGALVRVANFIEMKSSVARPLLPAAPPTRWIDILVKLVSNQPRCYPYIVALQTARASKLRRLTGSHVAMLCLLKPTSTILRQIEEAYRHGRSVEKCEKRSYLSVLYELGNRRHNWLLALLELSATKGSEHQRTNFLIAEKRSNLSFTQEYHCTNLLRQVVEHSQGSENAHRGLRCLFQCIRQG